MSASTFDRAAWQARRIRELDARVTHLEQYRVELEELVAALCELGGRTINAAPRDVLAGALMYVSARRDAHLEIADRIAEALQQTEHQEEAA
ncbi:MAG: hypothetical protein U0R50_16070 [Gaiellales bacterium]